MLFGWMISQKAYLCKLKNKGSDAKAKNKFER